MEHHPPPTIAPRRSSKAPRTNRGATIGPRRGLRTWSIALDDRSPEAWFGLGRALARTGQAEPALAAFERARKLGWSDDLDLELGKLHLAAKRVPEARALLQPLAADPHGGSVSKQAAKLLGELDPSKED